MKKFILPIILLILFIPFYVNAKTCDTDKISISSITVESKSDGVEELDEATANGRNINFNLSMSNVGDNIEYKIVVKNDSNEDYELDKNSFNVSSDYIKYILESENDTNIVKANSSKVVYLKVNYANEVPDDAFESGTYNDNKSMTLNLSTGDTINVPDTLKNPNTGVQSYIIILTLILIISITLCVILRKKKYGKFLILIAISAIIVPMSAYALCKCDINIESKIVINKINTLSIDLNCSYESAYLSNDLKSKLPISINYYGNITWNNLVNSINFSTLDDDVQEFITSSLNGGMLFRPVEQIQCLGNATSAFEIDNCMDDIGGYPDVFGIKGEDKIQTTKKGKYYSYLYCMPG